jgi:hypothetical protein
MAPTRANLTQRMTPRVCSFRSPMGEKNGIRTPAWREVLSNQEIWRAAACVCRFANQSRSAVFI